MTEAVIKKCVVCNVEFSRSKKSVAKCCSRKCSSLLNRPVNKTGVTKKCEVCNAEFYNRPSRSEEGKYCSQKCAGVGAALTAFNKRIIVECPTCKKEFRSHPFRLKQSKVLYCSQECYYESMRTVEFIPCEKCKKETLTTPSKLKINKHIYCSKKCAGTLNVKITTECPVCKRWFEFQPYRLKQSKTLCCSKKCSIKLISTGKYLPCEFCGKETWVIPSRLKKNNHIYCSCECTGFAFRSENYDPESRSSKEYKSWSEKVKRRDKKTCQICSGTEKLHAHHILSWKDHHEKRFDVDNGVTLCQECHMSVHHQGLKLDEAKILAQRETNSRRNSRIKIVKKGMNAIDHMNFMERLAEVKMSELFAQLG